MIDLAQTIGFLLGISTWLMYGAWLLHFLDQRTNEQRAKFIAIMLGTFAIEFISIEAAIAGTWPATFTPLLIMSFLAFTGTPLLISNKLVLILLAAYLASLLGNVMFSFFIGPIVYIIVLYGFTSSALKVTSLRMQGKT